MDKYKDIRIQAVKKADEIGDAIYLASKDPTKQITGEALVVYNEFREFNWFDQYPVESMENLKLLKKIVTINLYKTLKHNVDHPQRDKPRTKWEYVMGRVR